MVLIHRNSAVRASMSGAGGLSEHHGSNTMHEGRNVGRHKTPQNATETEAQTLTPAQAQALAALAAGQSVSEAASAAGVDRTTVHRWLNNDPGFVAEFNAARLEMVETVRSGVRKLAEDAIATLRELMGPNAPANVRLRAVELVLARVATDFGNERIGSPLPDQIAAEIHNRELFSSLSTFGDG